MSEIRIGHADLYVTDYNDSIPTDATLEVDANLLGKIKGGATIEYKPVEKEIISDDKTVQERYEVGCEVTVKAGVLTWNNAKMKNMIACGEYVDDATTHTRTLKLGSNSISPMKKYVVRLVHPISDTLKYRATILATASDGFGIAFNPENETVIDATFKAMSMSDGTKLILSEDYSAS